MAQRITIIGSGPGGYTAAFEAARLGAKVTLVEDKAIGGTCLNSGCIPTKTLRASAELFEQMREAKNFGISVGDIQIQPEELLKRKHKVSTILSTGLEKSCNNLKIRLVHGQGQVRGSHEVEVRKSDGMNESIPGDAVIIATGSQVRDLPSLPVDNKHIFSSEGALELDSLPKRLLIVGGGVIGCELACIYAAFGSQVTIVEGQNRVLPMPSIDGAMSQILQREMKKKKITLKLGSTITAVETTANGLTAQLGALGQPNSTLAHEPAEYDAIFVTVGRAPNTEGLGLAEAGIELDAAGYIHVDDCLETNVPGIYAVGDVLGPSRIMLAHMATREGLIAAQNALGSKSKASYDVVPSCIFVSPEIADVGLTEEQVIAQGINVKITQFQFRELGKAQAMGSLPGLFKLLADAKTGRLLGAHIAGAHASDMIAEAALAMQYGLDAKAFSTTIHAHPTLAEGLYEASRLFFSEA